jgi:hypothetical protein
LEDELKEESKRRHFLRYLGALPLVGAAPATAQPSAPGPASGGVIVPSYARWQDYETLKQSSYDRTGGNADSWKVDAGATRTVFESDGPGIVTHIWFTIAAKSGDHLKEIVLRMYWDGREKPSVEVPIGDFFGLNVNQYFLYQSAFLNCSSAKALNCYFAMPFKKSARMTVTNEGKLPIQAFYSNIDYQRVSSLPSDALYFHAQYRQAVPNQAQTYPSEEKELNPLGKNNYVFFEAEGKGHMMGITLGVLQNAEQWMGEGDEMIFIDDKNTPKINGTGTEDYICGAWDFGGRDTAIPFAYLYNGAPFIGLGERTGGRYCLYRWHADNPVAFNSYIKHTIEHGHANNRHDCYYSTAYWYQTEPYTDFPQLPDVASRIPAPVPR